MPNIATEHYRLEKNVFFFYILLFVSASRYQLLYFLVRYEFFQSQWNPRDCSFAKMFFSKFTENCCFYLLLLYDFIDFLFEHTSPVQIYNFSGKPQKKFFYSGSIKSLVVTFFFSIIFVFELKRKFIYLRLSYQMINLTKVF